jgi:hypothetical protein
MNVMNTHTPTQMAEIPRSESYSRHRRQRFWQVIAPVGFGVLVILVILGFVINAAVVTGGGDPVSQWADTSMIWLSLPGLMFALVVTIILIGMIYLMANLLKILPGYTFKLQYYVALGKDFIDTFADKVVAPIIAVRSASATVSALFGSIFGRRRD